MKNLDFSQKRVLLTGVSGTVGSELAGQLLGDYNVGELIGIDNDETELFFLEQRLHWAKNAYFRLADVRDVQGLNRLMDGIDIVYHTAAYKHVIMCERDPFDAVHTNILGVENIISAAARSGVKWVVFTSSDKAVNPTSVMGTTKLMGERLMTAANSSQRSGPIFFSTRFGNVLNSRGSVIPLFYEQIRSGGPVTLTDPKMTRFIMGIRDAVRLVIESTRLARGGEVFVTKMPVIKIKDLAEVMIYELCKQFERNPKEIEITTIGSKPGEKMYEELISHEEIRRSKEIGDYFVVLPAFKSLYNKIDYQYPGTIDEKINKPYNSSNEIPLSKSGIKKLLLSLNILGGDNASVYRPKRLLWPDDKNNK